LGSLSAPAIYAIGTAAASVAAIGIVVACLAINGIFYEGYAKSFSTFVLAATPSGLVCGWLCWRRLVGDSPLSELRALAIATTTIVSTLLMGGIVGSLLMVLPASLSKGGWRRAFDFFVEMFLPGLVLGPLYATVVFGIPFTVLIIAWTFWRRRTVNRPADP
jgi:hypothetical protein